MRPSIVTALTLVGALLGTAPVYAQKQGVAALLDKVGIDQNVGAQLPMDVELVDSTGDKVRLGDLMKSGRPVILSLVYYDCPMLCTQVLNGMLRAFRVLKLDVGKDFDIISLSIDHDETSYLAAQKKKEYIQRLGKPEAAKGWHFLTGDEDSIKQVADTVGFSYEYDEKNDQWAHAAGIMILTPEGKVSRYLFGIEYSVKTLRLSLVEASEGKVGDIIDAVMLLCFQYDPSIGKYSFAILSALRVGAGLTILLLGGYILLSIKKDREKEAGELPKGMKNHA